MNSRPISEDDLHAYVDGALEAVRQREIEEYLTQHPDVAMRVEAYAVQRDSLRKALAPFAEEPVPPELNLSRLIEARRRRVPMRIAAAAMVLVCLSGVSGWTLRGILEPPTRGIAALAQEAADSYAVYAPDRVQPVEMTARAAFMQWASQRLDRSVTVPDLTASGYRFLGGRLVATPHGPAMLSMYDNGRNRLVMLTRPMQEKDLNSKMVEHSRGDTTSYAWAKDGMGYSLVSELPSDALHILADEMRRQTKRDI